MKKNFYKNHLELFKKLIHIEAKTEKKLDLTVKTLFSLKKKGKKIIICGNGGSAAIASHIAIDLLKNLKIQSLPLTDASLITCFSNDFKHKNWMKKAIEHYYSSGDIVVIISSSGMSSNIVNAAKFCVKKKIKLISFSGMKYRNKLNLINKKGIYFWINSMKYNHIELAHLYLLLLIVDKAIFQKKKN